ncbi:ABC transporter ATP-binding protein [Isoptericola sp. NEAU-Y5]|uniref:ABC transporter ATP-binding protein n=1 Tax=Isoptericola luteus TaxID=2879484 RepID=A0ABS7ZFF0_9MICO|nr:ABC transporter ATP-binding protein [Isoptericola sp. NEAU-Y5]MCA5893744.1 ABC transporter ATP-binding protein [Isoptericola sp. NEAU-Y5]
MTALVAQHLRKTYRRRGRPPMVALDDVSLSVARGEVVGLLGRNGAGKSTTVQLLAGARAPDSGRVRVLGLDPRADRRRVRSVLGVQLQGASLHGALTVRELVRLYRSFYRQGLDPDRLVERVGLGKARDTRFEQLSGGQQQRVSVALALVGEPRAVVLDELTTGLDPEARRSMWALVEDLRADGVTVLLVSHHMEEVERLCDRVTILDAGRVVASGSVAGLVDRAGLRPTVTLRTDDPAAADLLAGLPVVGHVDARGPRLVVTGSAGSAGTGPDELLREVGSALARAGVVATETQLRRPGLDDAFLALTGSTLEAS